MSKKILFIFLVSFFIVGCANKKLGNLYYKEKNYYLAYKNLEPFAKKGFPKEAYKVAKLIYEEKVQKPPYIERKYALIAYKNGILKSSIIIADSYYKENNYKQALKWYDLSKFGYFNLKDFKNYIDIITKIDSFKIQKQHLNKLNKYAKQSNNPKLLTMLAKFYLKDSLYKNIKLGISYLIKAHIQNYYPATVYLGIFYIKNGQEEKGYKLLKQVAYKDKWAAYYLGNYLYNEMVKNEKLMNYGCSSSKFRAPKEFFYKKLKIYKFNDLFSRENVIKAYNLSYKLGLKKAIYKIIRLDIEDNTFENSLTTYSKMDLNEVVSFLKSQKDIESKLILAKIYEKYLYLNSYKKAKEIYLWYKNINNVLAIWHLYQYEKRFENKVNFEYLDYLTKEKFTPAIIEKAYQEIIIGKDIENNKKILEYYVKQNNILALNYMGSLYSKEIFLPKSKSVDFYYKACSLEKKPFYIPSEDLKIANFYNDYLKMQTKYLTINYYYSQMNNRVAELSIAKFYKQNCEYNKLKNWLEKLYKQNDFNGKEYYYIMILKRFIDDKNKFKEAIDYLKNRDDIVSNITLGDIYANGFNVEVNPKIAEKYYMNALELGYKQAINKLISMYESLNINNIYNKKIIYLYKLAIKYNLKDSKYKFAKFLYQNGKKYQALKILKKAKITPKIRYLLYVITGKIKYIKGVDSNFGYLLYAKALNLQNKNPKKALYYTFRAMLCNTPNTPKLSYILMEKINSSKIIKRIYEKAKKAPKCYIN